MSVGLGLKWSQNLGEEGGILRSIFTEYVPQASQPIQWPIIDTIVVTFEHM